MQLDVCSPHHCCTPPPCHYYSRCNRGTAQYTPDSAAVIHELSEKISRALVEIADLNTKMENITHTAQYQNDVQTSPSPLPSPGTCLTETTPLSPDIIIVEPVRDQPTPQHHDMSTSSVNTVDEHVENNDDLNSKAQTSQLPQLMHPTP